MKKTTLFGAMLIASSSLFSQSQFKWNGSQTVQEWDYATANWLDPGFPIPIPKTFVEGADAIFDDSSVEGSDTIKVNGSITVDSIKVNATKNYVIRRTADTDVLAGNGALIKDGDGTFVMDVKSTLLGGTILRKGTIMMEKQTTPNIFGAKLVFEGGVANFATTTSGSYVNNPVPLVTTQGVTAKVEMSRYSYFANPVSGSGDLEIATGGERAFMGTNKSGGVAVDWKEFTGNFIVRPYIMAGVTPGYYGLLLPITKSWDYTDINTADSLFWNRTVTIKSGAGLTGASGNRCWNIGELQAEDDNAFLGGYGAGKSNSPRIYYMIGGKNTDVVCPVTIKDVGGTGYNYLGIIKVGTGKYTFTSTKSTTTASLGVQVMQGTFIVDIPVTDETTALGVVSKANAMTISADAIGGGNGRITGTVEVDSLGTLVIGNGKIGEIVLADIGTGNTGSPLIVRKHGKVVFKIKDKNNFDKISTNRTATFNGGTIIVKAEPNYTLTDNDSITILTTRDRMSVDDTFVLKTEGFSGDITVTAVTDSIPAAGSKITLVIHNTAQAVKNIDYVKTVSVYPNPSVGEFNFSTPDSEIKSIQIMNLQGQVVENEFVNSKSVRLNLNHLLQGIYYAKINTQNKTEVHKLMINK